jgi:hypothetical protein
MSATRAQIERLTEVNIGAAIRAVTTRHVELFWSPTDEGLSKESARTCFEVRVLPRESEGYSSRQITLRAVLSVIASREDDATGAHMTEMFEALLEIIGDWDKDNDAASAALDIAGVFRCDGVMFGAGGDCGYDEQRAAWYASIEIEIVGCLTD